MAITWSSTRKTKGRPLGGMGGVEIGYGTFTGPASYTTGGEALDLATDEGLSSLYKVEIEHAQADSTRRYDCKYDYTAKKVVIYTAGTTTEVVATTDLSAYTFRVLYHGSSY